MAAPYKMVNLLKNRIYPTYQLHAMMASRKTSPEDGLRLGALVTLEWLKYRLGDNAPAALVNLPGPEAYKSTGNGVLESLHLNFGYVVDIVALPDRGIWALQITEPDLGSDPGKPDQQRPAVPGRVIETNIAFRVTGEGLECGFLTVISDPENTPEEAEVYRLAVARQLMEHPDFGLRQITVLGPEPVHIQNNSDLQALRQVRDSRENTLPCVVFTHRRQESAPPDAVPKPSPLTVPRMPTPAQLSAPTRIFIPELAKASQTPQVSRAPRTPVASPPPYNVERFARGLVGCCRTYVLSDGLLEDFNKAFNTEARPGDIAVLEPGLFGGAARLVKDSPNQGRRDQAIVQLRVEMFRYPRGREIDFGDVLFLSKAREELLLGTQTALEQTQKASGQWAEAQRVRDEQWRATLREREDSLAAMTQRLERQVAYAQRLEAEKADLRREMEGAETRHQARLDALSEDIAYLRRKLSQPRDHASVAEWVRQTFPDRLVLHPHAQELLAEKSAKIADVGLICDALDFLATDYWSRRYAGLSAEEMNTRCSEKYGRPFVVTPVGEATIGAFPELYKIRYGGADLSLTTHLRVGNDVEYLLRVYFLHDDKRKLIVVGSLPRHLKVVSFR